MQTNELIPIDENCQGSFEGDPIKVWLVWTDSGTSPSDSYRSLDGVFSSKHLADEFAAQLKAKASKTDDIEVTEENILNQVPTPAMHHKWSARVDEAGSDSHIGPLKPQLADSFEELLGPLKERWSGWRYPGRGVIECSKIELTECHLYITVSGTDLVAVNYEYHRLLGEARSRLGL